MADWKASILDALYQEYGKYVALAERTSHNTRMAYHDKADGILKAILIVEGFEAEPPPSHTAANGAFIGPRCTYCGHSVANPGDGCGMCAGSKATW